MFSRRLILFGGAASALLLARVALAASPVSTMLRIDVRRIVNETAVGDATLLFDEQSSIGDPRAGTGLQPTNTWTTPWSPWYYPVAADVDLGATCNVTDVSFFDANGTGELEVQALVSNVWVDLFTNDQDTYLNWVTIPVSTQTRYLRIVCYGENTIPPEMAIYGWALGPIDPYPNPTPPTPPTFDQFMGVNTTIADPLGRLEAFGCAREYHEWDWDEGGSPAYPNDFNQWFDSSTGGWNFDLYYRNLNLTGLLIAPCKEWSVNWLGLDDSQDKPILAGSGRDPAQPASYIEHADHFYQYAARYGATTVPDANLKLGPDEPRLSGLNLIHYIENWNEPDKTWKGRDGFFLPFEYAAMSSADADGHRGALGSVVGIKNADPRAKLVMAGLSNVNLDYIKSLKLWCDQNRGGNFPWDVINLHYYCSDANFQPDGQPTVGISPEAAGFRQLIASFADYRNRFLPHTELWVSEFGYDVNPQSVLRAPTIGATPPEIVQGEWLIRSYLELAAAGADRAFMFMMSDPSSTDSTQFATSGLLEDSAHQFAVRPGWFYCKTLKERLRGLRYLADQSSGNPNVTVYQFADATGAIQAYAAWCPTTNNTVVTGFTMPLSGSPASATLVTLSNGLPLGVTSPLTISAGNVTFNVSELPALVIVGSLPIADSPDTILTLSTNMVTNESGLGDPTLMTDEAGLVGDPADGTGGDPSTFWFPSWNAADYPASAYIDLGQVQPVTKLLLYDYNSAGLVTVSTGTPGNWQPLFTDDLRNWATWNLHVINVRTRYIRFTREDEGGNFAEVAVYANPWLNQFAVPSVTSLVNSNHSNLTLSGTGVPGSSIVIWSTDNLTLPVSWQPVFTNTTPATGLWQFIDPLPLGVRQRFYRAGSQ